MFRTSGYFPVSACAPGVLTVVLSLAASAGHADDWIQGSQGSQAVWQTSAIEPLADADAKIVPLIDLTPPGAGENSNEELPPDVELGDEYLVDAWTWQWLPTGIIYHSYMAGVHEPRMAFVAFQEGGNRTLWDATLGGRVGLWRYGDYDPLRPQGVQLDFYGAAVPRLDVEHRQDLDSTDYVFGLPLTYGVGDTQFKFGYAHLSSHLGDELALRDPQTLDERVNYVRDSLVLGISHYLYPAMRVYGEAGWAFHHSGGAQPWESQIGTELSKPGPTGQHGTPFVAVNGRMREEHKFGGDLTAQVGWLRRGDYGQMLRLGAQYYNGKSSQFQFYDQSEEQIGLGVWYDY